MAVVALLGTIETKAEELAALAEAFANEGLHLAQKRGILIDRGIRARIHHGLKVGGGAARFRRPRPGAIRAEIRK